MEEVLRGPSLRIRAPQDEVRRGSAKGTRPWLAALRLLIFSKTAKVLVTFVHSGISGFRLAWFMDTGGKP